MNDLPLITLGIPIYNAENMIEKTILSALDQTYPNIEYLFIDDKGNSMAIVYHLLERHPRANSVRIIDQKYNQGTGASRNAIVSNAAGEYLFTMDCDDVITPNCIEILYNKMKEYPVDFVSASFVRSDLQGNPCSAIFKNEDILIKDGNFAVAKYRYARGKYISVPTWNKLYRTSFLRKNQIYCIPHFLIDDTWFIYQVILRAQSCRLIPDCTLYFTYNPSSITTVKDEEGYTESLIEQYLYTEQLKVDYIKPLINETFYQGLLFDIMKMSFYHLYRAYASNRIMQGKKMEYLVAFSKLNFSYPKHWNYFDCNLYKLIPFLFYYSFPIKIQHIIICCMVKINLRRILGRWFQL